MPKIPTFMRLRQEYYKFKTNPSYIVKLCSNPLPHQKRMGRKDKLLIYCRGKFGNELNVA